MFLRGFKGRTFGAFHGAIYRRVAILQSSGVYIYVVAIYGSIKKLTKCLFMRENNHLCYSTVKQENNIQYLYIREELFHKYSTAMTHDSSPREALDSLS